MNRTQRIKELIEILNKANHHYYNLSQPIMTDKEYDTYYDDLRSLETQTGVMFSNSPTQNVGYQVISKLQKVEHEVPLLSLDKTKSVEDLKKFLGNKEGVLMLKADGLTTELDYEEGKFTQASTRGDGYIGEDITHNVKTYKNIPLQVEYNNDFKIAGESIITYYEFEKINEKLSQDEQYKNPRNLASGSVRQLNSKVCAERNVRFFAFNVLKSDIDFSTKSEQFRWLKEQGFEVIEYRIVNRDNIEKVVEYFKELLQTNNIPSDGLVLTYNDIAYGLSLGATAKHPRHSVAFKWYDESVETTLRSIEWQTNRTGVIKPIAIFDTVEIDGTDVSRASVHNISIIEEMELGIGDKIRVMKSNLIIPQIEENITRSGDLEIPNKCPVCGGKAEVRKIKDSKSLYCTNDDCSAKKLQQFVHYASRDAMNIEGLSEATLEKFIGKGFLHNFTDIYGLDQYKNQIVRMEGFGLKSYNNLISAIEKSKNVKLENFIYALGIPNVGLQNAKVLCKHFNHDCRFIINAITYRDLIEIEGFGEIISKSINDYFKDLGNQCIANALVLNILNIQKPKEINTNGILEGKTFVVTGDVEQFKNRKELQAKIEELCGKVAGSVSAKTNYLINNDNMSGSSKNQSAKKLGIPIITEKEFLELIGEN